MSRGDASAGTTAEKDAGQQLVEGTHRLTVNGEPLILPVGSSLVDLVIRMTGRALGADGTPADGGRLGIAVAVDSTVVPRSLWPSVEPTEDQEIEIITAMQGG